MIDGAPLALALVRMALAASLRLEPPAVIGGAPLALALVGLAPAASPGLEAAAVIGGVPLALALAGLRRLWRPLGGGRPRP